ncbi:hypothetical protein [Cystobacter ferrugineus]|uniref:hypothetical protein n=1 Tax=Cystobacter ferrugineus TaxID=83449 RepID=UPI000AFAECAF|nr:hypothetical protein [Cystobacter ferrugineus]
MINSGCEPTGRETLKAKVRADCVQMLDAQPDELSLAAVNRHRDIKVRGVS